MEEICYNPIGIIRSPFLDSAGMPIQAVAAKGIVGSIELLPEYEEGLKDLNEFSYLVLLYHFHLTWGKSLTVTPFLDNQPHGIFATRSPQRPNPIGFSIVRLKSIAGCILQIEDVDVIDGTPLLDIKPYIPAFDIRESANIGWFARNIDRVEQVRADRRFQAKE